MKTRILIALALTLVAVALVWSRRGPSAPLSPQASRLEAAYQFWLHHHPTTKREAIERGQTFLRHDRATAESDLDDERAKWGDPDQQR